MINCPRCGAPIDEQLNVCPYCGMVISNGYTKQSRAPKEKESLVGNGKDTKMNLSYKIMTIPYILSIILVCFIVDMIICVFVS